MQDKEFAKRVVTTMEKCGFTQRSLAKSVGVSQATVSRLLKGTLPALAVGIRLSSVLNVDHRWLIEGVEPAPEIKFDEGMRRRLLKARLLEGMEIADIAKIAALPEQTFLAVENGTQPPNNNLLGLWMRILNVEERFILEGRGRLFRSESRFILIPPEEIEKREAQLKQLRLDAEFLNRRIERLEWELARSRKQHQSGPYHPSIISDVRNRAPWND
jgi:transcriptional regulator with XRE-family HTH domain